MWINVIILGNGMKDPSGSEIEIPYNQDISLLDISQELSKHVECNLYPPQTLFLGQYSVYSLAPPENNPLETCSSWSLLRKFSLFSTTSRIFQRVTEYEFWSVFQVSSCFCILYQVHFPLWNVENNQGYSFFLWVFPVPKEFHSEWWETENHCIT